MTIIGTFDPSSETRPAISYPSSPNLMPASSAESASPTVNGTGPRIITWDTAAARSGARGTRVTLDIATFPGSGAWSASRPLAPVIPVGTDDVIVSVWIRPSAGLVGRIVQISANPSSNTDWTLVAGWQRIWKIVPNALTSINAVEVRSPAGTGPTSWYIDLQSGALDGETIDVDDWMVENDTAATGTPSSWTPQTSEPLYTAGQSWVSTGTGTLEGIAVTPGDLVTTGIPVGDYEVSAGAAWEITQFLTDIGDALQQKPIGIQGHPVGLGDWRIVYQMLLPADSRARWGIARWGEQIWSGIAWYDITEYVRGSSWSRGASSFGERPEVGTAEITLDNRGYQFSPWNGISSFQDATFVTEDGTVLPGYLGPGTVVRIVAYSPSGQIYPLTDPGVLEPDSQMSWAPQFSGVVESWTDATVAKGADAYVSVVLKETISTLARVDALALGAPVGAGELPEARITRLLDAAGWKYGPLIDQFTYVLGSSGIYTLQSTLMAQNRISELYLTADSVAAVIRSDRSGALVLYNAYPNYQLNGIARGPEAGPIELGPVYEIVPPFDDLIVAYVADSLDVANDDEVIQNVVRLAYVGGTERTDSDPVSIAQYEESAYDRTDLICQSNDLLDAMIADRLAARARRPLRLSALLLHSGNEGSLAAIIGLDVDNIVDVEISPGIAGYRSVVTAASIQGYRHDVTPLPGSTVVWTAAIETGLQGDLTMEET